MKLNLLFMVMDLFILLAYPFVFMHGKLRQFLKSKESIPPAIMLVIDSVTPDR
jgi:hypothetical protein